MLVLRRSFKVCKSECQRERLIPAFSPKTVAAASKDVHSPRAETLIYTPEYLLLWLVSSNLTINDMANELADTRVFTMRYNARSWSKSFGQILCSTFLAICSRFVSSEIE